ncbi:class I adenylate-forming enzyme family protein [Actibacterium pelagium]|uniref:Acetyl-CoA synthetase n=1 Tax=Actibacterium pelagium TaxID=2029103 RepID=A0A917AD46_9RHOB|nr:class I adenylate-forming enzyme family protein [Actibacterium pelagium]GGE42803.1 acetyl-CoA synthetase [Actibacterium pelagium]
MLSITSPVAHPPCPSPFNLAEYVLHAGRQTPDKLALAIVSPTGAERWSFERLSTAVEGVAAGLRDKGLPAGARILLRLGNTVDFPIAFLGAIAAGLVPVPTSAQLTGPEITKIADQVKPSLVIASDGIALPDGNTPILTTKDLEGMFELPSAGFEMGDPERPAYIVFTSGSSGQPRGVIHAHRTIWARRMMWDGWYGLLASDRVLHAGAFNWTYTLGTGLLDPWSRGATSLIPATGVDPQALPLLLKRFDATIFAAAPGVYRQVLKNGIPISLPKLRHGLSAGEKLPHATAVAWTEATGKQVFEALGMSECSTFISGSPSRPAPELASGYPQEGRKIAVLDDNNEAVPTNTPGNLAIHRSDPGLMLGYLDGGTDKFTGNWFVTGDTVQMADDYAVSYLGRDDDQMNAGGFRVSPIEVEQTLGKHSAIAEVAVTEVQVKADASVIAAFYTGEEQDSATLADYAAGVLARYKQPRIFIHVPSLPKGGNGKINRRQLRQEYEANLGQA